ncbi:hypothetical protein ACJMK2_008508 [Sinanodonta woodiana]|uniref:KY-like immunoglobulin-like domain-containing protein n=1 Tax=Sinanodonta woodiana TaxID=1069815 RepID=A0ABD3VNE7_SINWO
MGSKNSQSTVDQDNPFKWLMFTFEPAHILGLEYSRRHRVYTNDLSKLRKIPGPGQKNGKKSVIRRPEVIYKANRFANSVDQTLNKMPLNLFLEALTKDLESDFAKTRAIYRWLTIQPIRTIKKTKSEVDKNTAEYLLRLVENRLTYAQLFSILCGMIDVPCVVISGFTKGSAYQVGEKLTKKHRAEWNAVLINEIWCLVDTFWGACEIVGKSTTELKYSYDDYYFLTDPEQFIYTHFPDVSKWQLLDKSISMRKFRKQACLKQRFFELGMKSLADTLCCLETKDGDVSLVFGLNRHRSKQQTFECYVKAIEPDKKHNTNDLEKTNDDSSSNVSDTSTVPFPVVKVKVKLNEENETTLSIKIRFQEAGKYKIEIVGKERQVKNADNEFDWIAIFNVHVKKINWNKRAKEALHKELVRKTKALEWINTKEQMIYEIDKLRQTIFNAMESKKIDQLEAAVRDAIANDYAAELGVEIAKAKEAIDRLKRLQKLRQGVLELNQKTIAEIRSYIHPPEEVFKVIRATLLLLGNNEDETKNWKNVQALIGKTGKLSMKMRVKEFDIDSLQIDVALRSKQILDGTKFETVCGTSAGAAGFFIWVTGMISEAEQKYASTTPRTTKS